MLLYNLGCYSESFTNPVGVLERLYLGLGHERFVQSVFVFGSERCRYSCLPIRPQAEFSSFLQTLPRETAAYYDTECARTGGHGKDVTQQLALLRERFTGVDAPGGGRFQRFALTPEAGHP